MITGIYKITNLINNHCYIGQSRNIEKRWNSHKSALNSSDAKLKNYPLYKAFSKYGLENFSFEVVEECPIEMLNDKERYWIIYYQPEYNQTIGGDYKIIPQKLTYEQVQEIQKILLSDKNGNVSHVELSKKYNVSKDTIRDINVGRTWHDDNLTYPLHYSKFCSLKPENLKSKKYCKICNKEIDKSNESLLCRQCYDIQRKKDTSYIPITREELKILIRKYPFTHIGCQYGVTDNAVRKWCDKYGLPRRVKDIKTYSDEEWQNI